MLVENLRSIIYNLLSNAIKYRLPEPGLVFKIKTFRQGDEIVLSISDNGLGIEKTQLPKIFKMFKRVHHHTEGTGVGLYIIKRILENSSGRVEIEREVNKGSTFRVFFGG